MEKENIEARWIPTDQMLVDSLTKVGAPMCLLRRVLKEGRFVLVQNEEMQRWAGKIARKCLSMADCFGVFGLFC